MASDFQQILLALLLSTSEAVDIRTLQDVFRRRAESRAAEGAGASEDTEEPEPPDDPVAAAGAGIPGSVTASAIRGALLDLAEQLRVENSVYRIVEGPEGFRCMVAPRFAEWVRLLRGEPRELRLTPAMLETLAIVAYRQPVTRPEMERIRGVAVDSALGRLQEVDLVAAVGRADLPGRPVQYGTTTRFLEIAGLRSLDDLPASDVVPRRQLDEWLGRSAVEQPELEDADLGLPAAES